jgi:hypothetical protein
MYLYFLDTPGTLSTHLKVVGCVPERRNRVKQHTMGHFSFKYSTDLQFNILRAASKNVNPRLWIKSVSVKVEKCCSGQQ